MLWYYIPEVWFLSLRSFAEERMLHGSVIVHDHKATTDVEISGLPDTLFHHNRIHTFWRLTQESFVQQGVLYNVRGRGVEVAVSTACSVTVSTCWRQSIMETQRQLPELYFLTAGALRT